MKKNTPNPCNRQPAFAGATKYIGEKEAAAILGFNAEWLAKRRRAKEIEFSDFGHKGIRYSLDQIKAFAEKHTVRPVSTVNGTAGPRIGCNEAGVNRQPDKP